MNNETLDATGDNVPFAGGYPMGEAFWKSYGRMTETRRSWEELATILTAVEFGFRCGEKGQNLEWTLMEAHEIWKGDRE